MGLLALLILPPVSIWVYQGTNAFAAWRPMKVSAPNGAVPFRWPFMYSGDTPLTGRVIASVEGPIAVGHPISAHLYLVQNGVVKDCGSASSGRSAEPRPKYRTLRIVIGLAEADQPAGKLTVLNARGGSRAGGWGEVVSKVESRFQSTYTGNLPKGSTQLLYVEGDREFVADREMAVEQFAKANDGNYLVVTVTRN